MSRVGARDLRGLLDLVGTMQSARDLDEFRRELLPGLRRLVPADYASFNEILDGRIVLEALADPPLTPEQTTAWGRLAAQNPLVIRYARTRDGRTYRFSDVVTQRELRELEVFREFYVKMGVRHQIAFALASPPELTRGIALARGGRDFSDTQRELLNLARPHLLQAYLNARLREHAVTVFRAIRRGLSELGEAVAVLDGRGRVIFASEPALDIVRALGGEEGRRLPEALEPPRGRPWEPRTLQHRGAQIIVRRVSVGGDEALVSFERSTEAIPLAALRGLGLTDREAQVLQRFTQGDSVTAAAARLGVSPRTIHKHTQRIHAKLGTSDRAQAVTIAHAAAPVGATFAQAAG